MEGITTDRPIHELIRKLASQAKSVLVLGQGDFALQSDVISDVESITQLSWDRLDKTAELKRFDFVLIQDLTESLPRKNAEQIIARIRDRHARQMLVITSISRPANATGYTWQPADFISLGMKLLAEFRQDGEEFRAYHYALESYKKVPEWLNSRNWANPEMFDKYRW